MEFGSYTMQNTQSISISNLPSLETLIFKPYCLIHAALQLNNLESLHKITISDYAFQTSTSIEIESLYSIDIIIGRYSLIKDIILWNEYISKCAIYLDRAFPVIRRNTIQY